MSVVPPTEIGFDTVGMVRRTNPLSTGTAAGGIGLVAASVAVRVEEVIGLDVTDPIAERPSLIVPAWESDHHTLTLITRPTPMDDLMR
jgi:hypothetical protein